MIFTAYFLVEDRPLCFTVDLLCLMKLLLYLVDLHTFVVLSSLDLHIGVTTGICSFFMLSQCIKTNLKLSYSIDLIISYPTHCFIFSIVFYMCACYKIGR